MIQIVMKPVPGEKMVDKEYLYAALFNGNDIKLRVRGQRASHAEAKLMEIFRDNISRKVDESGVVTVDYDLEAWMKEKGEAQDEEAQDGEAD